MSKLILAVLLNTICCASYAIDLKLLETLVNQNSYSENLTGIAKVRSTLIAEFRKLGFRDQTFILQKEHRITALSFPKSHPKVLLVGHLDTVFPPQQERQSRRFQIKEGRIYGPGVIDMKGGLVVILEILKKMSLEERSHIRIVLNDDEELASVYSRDKLREMAKGIPFSLIFEPGSPEGAVVTSSIGGKWVKVTVQGKAAHAGLEHEKGLNACVELAHQMIQIHQLTDYSRRITANVGVIEGGTKPNVVCERASAVIDFRYVEPADGQEVLQKIKDLAAQSHIQGNKTGALPKIEIEVLAEVPSLPKKYTDKLFGILQSLQTHAVKGIHVGYGTDANHLSLSGGDLLVGLGPFGGGMHTSDEYLEISSLESRIDLGHRLILALLKPKQQGDFQK